MINKNWRYSVLTFCIIILLSTSLTSIGATKISFDVKIVSTILISRDGWESQDSGSIERLSGVSFNDSDIGTIVGDSAVILHTNDGGENWDFQTCGVAVNFYDVSFYNEDIGMAVGADGTIIDTNNGGVSWNTYQTGWMTAYFGTHMVTDLVGFAVGVNTIFQPFVTWTIDGWTNHNDVAFYLEKNSVFYEGNLRDVCFIDTITGFAAAAVWNGEGAIVKTTDGGWTWETIFWANNAFYGIDFPSEDVGYAVGNNGIIVKTSDGGDNWEILNSGVINNFADVSFPTEDIGIVVGDIGIIMRTEDGGDSWSEQDSDTTNDLFSVYFIDPKNGYTVGEGGTILHYKDNQPPNAPTITGETEGNVNAVYDYTFNAVDPDGDMVKYYIDWGDTTFNVTDPSASGVDVIVPHTFTTEGTFTIIAYAEDEFGLTGPSNTLEVTMKKSKASPTTLIQIILERYPILIRLFQTLIDYNKNIPIFSFYY